MNSHSAAHPWPVDYRRPRHPSLLHGSPHLTHALLTSAVHVSLLHFCRQPGYICFHLHNGQHLLYREVRVPPKL